MNNYQNRNQNHSQSQPQHQRQYQYQTNDLESTGSHYNISIKNLQSIFDPKSLRNLINLGGINLIINDLNTDIHNGLPINNNDKLKRLKIYGQNKLPPKNEKSFLNLCWDALHDQVLIVLSISAIVSLILGIYQSFYEPPEFDDDGNPLPRIQWVDGFAILLAVIIVVFVGALNDYNKEKQFRKLNNKKEDRNIIVYRSNEKMLISIYDLLVGDLLYVETGDIIPADSILISGECSCDESSITGESKTINKKTIYQSLDYFNDEIKSLNSSSNSNLNLNISSSSSSTTSSYQFDVGDLDVLDPFLISGSKLLSGQGKALVVCVGENSINGKIMKSLSNDDSNDSTPLQQRLDILAHGISKYGFLAAILLFIILFIKFIYQLSDSDLAHLPTADKLSKLINIIITAITIVVVAIPEGLPLAVTLALAFATTRMTEDGNLVRVLKSCETMGAATTICSDKTGTLTINKMTVVTGLLGTDVLFDDLSSNSSSSSSNNSNLSSIDAIKLCSNNLIQLLLHNILLNSTAFENLENDNQQITQLSEINQHKKSFWNFFSSFKTHNHILPVPSSSNNDNNNSNTSHKDDFVGSKTECALLSLVKNKFNAFDHSILNLSRYRNINESNIVVVIPFESSLKWSGIVYHDKNDDSYTFLIKGAAEIILSHCVSLTNIDGTVTELTKSERKKIDKIRESMASQALRAVSLAHHKFTNDELSQINWENIDAEKLKRYPLSLDLTVGIQDPLRPGVKDAISQCRRAGVDVRMVTGDNVLTARAISKGCGILNDESYHDENYFMEGPKFRSLSESERLKIVPKLHILARSSPEDKRILVETLKKLGEVVAVTGDGTNDAPALKLADVGFSMGLSGTEVAREASDIVLMSDDFASIVNAIKWGRTVAASIKKFVQFQLTVNFTAVSLTFITAISSKEDSSVLTAVQLLWVNLIMDTLAALALATDKPDDDVLDSKPEGRNNKMITTNMWKMIIGMTIAQLTITLTLNFYGSYFFFGKSDDELKIIEDMMLGAMTFNTFVWMQVFTMFVSRILNEPTNLNSNSTLIERLCPQNIGFFRHLGRNYWFIGITGLISILQILIMLYGGAAFSIVPQSFAMWLTTLLGGFLMIPIGTLLRLIPDEWLLKTLPISSIQKFINTFEWFMFGCGMCFSSNNEYDVLSNDDNDDTTHNNDYNDNNNNNNTQINYNVAGQYYTENRLNNNSNPDIILSDTPSPILESSHRGESHKMNRLQAILTNSNNTSVSSLHRNSSNHNTPSFLRSKTPSHEFLLDESSQKMQNYTESDNILKPKAKV